MFFYSENIVDLVQEMIRLSLTSSSDTLLFGNTIVNNTSSVTFTVSADGNLIETVTLVDDSNQFTFSPSSFTLTGSGSPQTVTVTFAPNVTGSLSGILIVSASGGDVKNILLSGSSGIYKWMGESILFGSLAKDASDNFGYSMAINNDGNRIVICARSDEKIGITDGGLAYVFISGTNGWSEQTILSGSLVENYDYFGQSVAINSDGNRIVIGALQDERSSSPGIAEGLVYIFTSGSSGWFEEKILSGTLATGSVDGFGNSVAINSIGDRILVGAPYDERLGQLNTQDEGLAYVFVSGAAGWSQQQILSGSLATGSSDSFGFSVAMNSVGDRIVIGSLQDERFGQAVGQNEGLAYIFVSGANGWSQQQILSGSLATGSADIFANSVAMNSAGDIVVIGAKQDERLGQAVGQNEGLVYVFISGSNGWSQQQILSGSLATGSSDSFGQSVAINSTGDRIIVGAHQDERLGQLSIQSEGLAYIFVSGANGWTQENIFSGAFAINTTDVYGYSVAINASGNRIMVGAMYDETGSTTSTGLAYVYDYSFVTGNLNLDYFISTSSINFGDLGTSSLPIISSSTFNVSVPAGYIYSPLVDIATITISSSGDFSLTPANALTQALTPGFGGVNSTITASFSPSTSGEKTALITINSNFGNKYISLTGSSTVQRWFETQILSGSLATGLNDYFGNSVAINSAGDRIIVGAAYDERSGQAVTQNEGLCYIYISGTNGWSQQQILSGSIATGSSDNFGFSVAINSIGDRIAIGALQDERLGQAVGQNEGLVYIFISGSNGWSQQQILSGSLATGSADYFGYSVAMNSAGDRLVVGSRQDERIGQLVGQNEGLAYVFISGSNGWSQQQILSGSLATGSADYFGASIAMNSAGDRIIVGTYQDERLGQLVGQNEGLAYIFVSGANGWTQQQILSGSLATGSSDIFGFSVDMNSAGDRVIVASPQDERLGQSATQNEGLCYIFISGTSGWSQQQILSGSLATGSGDYFGYSVAMNSDGDRVIVGAYIDERTGQSATQNEGLAYVFISGTNGWVQENIFSGSLATSSNDYYGSSVAINSAGDRIIVGAYQDERSGQSATQNEGVVYINDLKII